MTFGWNEKPTKASPKRYLGGDNPAAVYEIGGYEVTVRHADDVTTKHLFRHGADPRQTLPNMEIADGEIRIPVTDLVPLVLTRLDPVELARALWQDDDVKESFMDCLATRWSEEGIGDVDRRKFLLRVKEAVHSKAVDDLAETMRKLEFDVGRRFNMFDQIKGINAYLRDLDICRSDGTLLQVQTDAAAGGTFSIGGTVWEEARDHWRSEVRERFTGPDISAD
jgi:hypothetical protein